MYTILGYTHNDDLKLIKSSDMWMDRSFPFAYSFYSCSRGANINTVSHSCSTYILTKNKKFVLFHQIKRPEAISKAL